MKKWSKYLDLSILLLLLFVNPVALSQEIPRVQIRGIIIDANNREPLYFANVFLSNTTLGAATDRLGKYAIPNIPLGEYDLVVSMVGYQIEVMHVDLRSGKNKEINFELQSRPIQAPTLQVTAPYPRKWRRDLKKFKKMFIGVSQNAKKCEILNPEVLDFQSDTSGFFAFAHQPLNIINSALGYRIQTHLNAFSFQREELHYSTKSKFELMNPENETQAEEWRNNRLLAYCGSARHFFTSLISKRWHEEYFTAYLIHTRPGIFDERAFEVSDEDLLSQTDSPFERKFTFPKNLYMRVIYTDEEEPNEYHFVEHYGPARRLPFQMSWVGMNEDSVTMNKLGHIYEGSGITLFGYWAWEKFAEALPLDYIPDDASQTLTQDLDYYTEGLEQRQSGHWEQALKTWRSGWAALEIKNKTDPRIGIAFVELATEKKAEKYYDTASEIYMWGFSKNDCKEFKEVFTGEAERIVPLLSEEEARAWRKRIKSKDPGLGNMIRLFWLERDPRPKTKANERLIEHWERIAHARKHFQKTNHSVYDCDDRGTIYVKYGKPDKKKSGSVGSSSAGQMELMRFFGIGEAGRSINLRDPAPDYEVWAYGDIGTDKPSIFLFSNRDGTGSFGLRSGIESLFPRTNNIYTERGRGQLYASRDYLVYQLMYYAELRDFTRFFDERYTEINQIWEGAERELRTSKEYRGARNRRESFRLPRHYIQLLHGMTIRNEGEDELNPIYKYADNDKSDYENLKGKINIKAHPVRTLDRQNKSKLSILAFSSPQFRAEDIVRKTKNDFAVPEYILSHTLIVRDQTFEETERIIYDMSGGPNNMSAFSIDHTTDHAHFIIASEAYQLDVTDQDTVQYTPSKILAIGKEIISVSPPLNTDPGELELSDLVLGIDVPPDIELTDFPFSVIPTREFTLHDPVKMAIGIYHLVLNDEAEAQYTIEYGVARLDKKGRRRKQQISMAYSFNSQDRSARESLSVDISKLKAGPYEFFVKVKDQVSRQEKAREVLFVVVE